MMPILWLPIYVMVTIIYFILVVSYSGLSTPKAETEIEQTGSETEQLWVVFST